LGLVVSTLQLTISNWGSVVLDKRQLKAVMRGAGGNVRTQTARLINKSSGSGRAYRGGGGSQYRGNYRPGHYTASAVGSPPVRVSGTLREKLKTYVYPSGEGFAVRDRQFYALWLETGAHGGGNPFGGRPEAAAKWRATLGTGRNKRGMPKHARGRYKTRKLEPRPFLDRVMAQQAPEINRRVYAALTEGLKWKETKT
jgi:hypothetical protein